MTERWQSTASANARFFTGVVLLVIAATAALLFVWAWPRLSDAIIEHTVVAVPVVVSCRPPAETEQLHIVTWVHEGRILGRCLYVGSTGTYYRKPRS